MTTGERSPRRPFPGVGPLGAFEPTSQQPTLAGFVRHLLRPCGQSGQRDGQDRKPTTRPKKGAAPLNLRQVRLQLGDLSPIKQFNADAKSLPAAHILPARLIASFVIKHVQAPFVLDEMICLKVVCQTLPPGSQRQE